MIKNEMSRTAHITIHLSHQEAMDLLRKIKDDDEFLDLRSALCEILDVREWRL